MKYERVPHFCELCGCVGHGDRNCRLPEDLKRVWYTTAMRASPYKPQNHRSGHLAPDAGNARHFLHFGSEMYGEAKSAPPGLAGSKLQEKEDTLLIVAVKAVDAIQMSNGAHREDRSDCP